jgi:hypothetical protein
MLATKKLLTLILSFDDGPHGQIQREGQNPTFVSSAPPGTLVMRYVGRAMDTPFPSKAIFALRKWQYALLDHSKFWPIGSILRFAANFRFLDRVILSIQNQNQNESVKEVSLVVEGSPVIKTIITPSPEDWSLIGLKTIIAFKHVLKNYEFDYLFRTNTSSYVDTQKLLGFLESQPKSSLYGGVIGTVFEDTKFASGAGILLSRDVVERICEREHEWKHGYVDDVALAEVVSKLNEPQVPLVALPRVDLPTYEAAVQIDPEIIKSNFHFRCKSDSPEETIKIMHHIHKVKNVS